MTVSVFCEETAGAARCLMSSAASERSLPVKAPSITAPPCGLSLHQQPGNLSTAEEVPWVRITLSQSYFIHCFLTVLLISLFRTSGASLSPSFLLFHTCSLSLVLPLLCPRRQIGFLHLASFTTPAIFNSSRSPSKEAPTPPFLRLSPTPHACLSGGGFEKEKGPVIKDKDESKQRETNTDTNKPLSCFFLHIHGGNASDRKPQLTGWEAEIVVEGA